MIVLNGRYCHASAISSDRALPKLRLNAYERVWKLVMKNMKMGFVGYVLQTRLRNVGNEKKRFLPDGECESRKNRAHAHLVAGRIASVGAGAQRNSNPCPEI